MNPSGQAPPPRPDLGRPAASREILQPYATFWQRVAGRVIDGLILSVPFVAMFLAVFWDDVQRLRDQLGRTPTTWDLMHHLGGGYVALTLLVLGVSAVYEIGFLVSRGQTIGHRAVGIKVMRVEDGGLPTFDRALIRWAVPNAAPFLIPGTGGLLGLLVYLWMLWDPKRQGLHDKAARTVVMRVDRGRGGI